MGMVREDGNVFLVQKEKERKREVERDEAADRDCCY
jgi:hypothetical protein